MVRRCSEREGRLCHGRPRSEAGGRIGRRELVAESLHRFEQHALRSAERADRLQPALADPVVDRPPRDAEQLRGMVQRDAAADTRFEAGFRTRSVSPLRSFAVPPTPCVRARAVPAPERQPCAEDRLQLLAENRVAALGSRSASIEARRRSRGQETGRLAKSASQDSLVLHAKSRGRCQLHTILIGQVSGRSRQLLTRQIAQPGAHRPRWLCDRGRVAGVPAGAASRQLRRRPAPAPSPRGGELVVSVRTEPRIVQPARGARHAARISSRSSRRPSSSASTASPRTSSRGSPRAGRAPTTACATR